MTYCLSGFCFWPSAAGSGRARLGDDLARAEGGHFGKSRRELFEEIEQTALSPLPPAPFKYAEWKSAKVHPDYHVEIDRTFSCAVISVDFRDSVPRRFPADRDAAGRSGCGCPSRQG